MRDGCLTERSTRISLPARSGLRLLRSTRATCSDIASLIWATCLRQVIIAFLAITFEASQSNVVLSAVAAFRAEVDDPVGGYYHFEIALDHFTATGVNSKTRPCLAASARSPHRSARRTVSSLRASSSDIVGDQLSSL